MKLYKHEFSVPIHNHSFLLKHQQASVGVQTMITSSGLELIQFILVSITVSPPDSSADDNLIYEICHATDGSDGATGKCDCFKPNYSVEIGFVHDAT